jgi:Flp pilus assembly protein TadD
LEGAVADFTKALELDGRLPRAYANRGLAFMLEGKDEEAEKDFSRALTLAPGLRGEMEEAIRAVKASRATVPLFVP